MEINIGEKAPDFTLYANDKLEVSLYQFQGKKVVLFFFPLAFSGACTKEVCTIRDNLSAFNDLDAQVLAISVDSLFVLERFREVNNCNFPMLSDFNKSTIRSYGALHEAFDFNIQGVAKRSVFVIDGVGILRYKEILDDPSNFPDFEKVKEVLAAI